MNEAIYIPEECTSIAVASDYRGEPRTVIYFVQMYVDQHEIGPMRNLSADEMKEFAKQLDRWSKSKSAFPTGMMIYSRKPQQRFDFS